ncbi:unnamed protein product [Linum tenue]|uniref:Uncharacterized protein n=1 Tax=Linum tenue TaxID=586396 RepID=A0AAV0L172_9ROSI|nr:unnamed protein product [Linum tenue]
MDESEPTSSINGTDNKASSRTVHVDDDDGGGLTLFAVLNRMVSSIFAPASGGGDPAPLLQRIKASLSENGPLLKDATANTGRKILVWTRSGSPLRALLVISVSLSLSLYFSRSLALCLPLNCLYQELLNCLLLLIQVLKLHQVGTIALLAMTGILVFMLFFLAATINAIVISLLMSLAAAGGFLALVFTCLAAIYIGALSIAIFAISTATISAIIAVVVATGWIGFFWTIWLVTKKTVGVATHSLSLTGSAISTYSSAWQTRDGAPSKEE